MRFFISLIFIATLIFGNSFPKVSFVDPERFSGLWYEIARTYNSFEKECVAPTVEYVYNEDETYTVFNRCFRHTIGGELITYEGSANAVKKGSMSTMDMTYFWIFTQTYEVKYLDNYETAIVTDKELDKVWLMHRKPFLEASKKESILVMLGKHMDLKRLIFSPQDIEGRYK